MCVLAGSSADANGLSLSSRVVVQETWAWSYRDMNDHLGN